MDHLLSMFDCVRIINLADRTDRWREIVSQFSRIGGMTPNISMFRASRPTDAGAFPSIGARGCFESHLSVLRQARDAGARRLLIVEDDLDFCRDIARRGPAMLAALAARPWSFFYGAHELDRAGDGLVPLDSDVNVVTASFVAIDGPVIPPLVAFLEAMLCRPAGSRDYGPMHVDGAYYVFQKLHPEYAKFAAFPPLGWQRSSRSDITASGMVLDRFAATRGLAERLRHVLNRTGGLRRSMVAASGAKWHPPLD